MTWVVSPICRKCRGERDGTHGNYCRRCYQAYTMQRAYGMTVAEWDDMLEAQGGGCAICGTRTPGGRGRFHVDHDHTTQRVRGLLCANCNLALGLIRDNPATLHRMVDYLERRFL